MTYLKFYQKENDAFKTEYNIHLEDKQAIKIAKKISRHFKFTVNEIKIYGKKSHGYAWFRLNKIKIPHNTSLSLLIHELAHLYEYQKHNNERHNKQLMKTIQKFIKYCRKKNYWLLEG